MTTVNRQIHSPKNERCANREGANTMDAAKAHLEADTIIGGIKSGPDELYEYKCEQGFRTASELYTIAGNRSLAARARLSSLAFSFAHGTSIVPGKHFVPKYTYIDDSTYPNIHGLPDGFRDYLEHESAREENPILRARYLDLLWDLYRVHQAGKEAIDTYLAAAALYETSLIERKALDVAWSLRRAEELTRTLKTPVDHVWSEIVNYFGSYVAESRWRDVIHLLQLISPSPPKSFIPALRDSTLEAIQALQNEGDYFAAHVGLGLLDTLNLTSGSQKSEVRKRIAVLIEQRADQEGTAFSALATYDQALRLFMDVQDAAATQRVLTKMQKFSKAELYRGFGAIPISVVAVDQAFVGALEANVTSLGLKEGLRSLSRLGIPSQVGLEEWLEEISRNAPMFAHLQFQTIHPEGTIDPTDDPTSDASSGLRKLACEIQIYQFLITQFSPLLRQLTVAGSISADFLSEVAGSMLEPSRRAILRNGFRCFFEQDYVASVHVLVPSIEAAVRELARQCDISVMEPIRTKNNGVQFVTLGTLLRRLQEERIDDVDQIEYLKFVLLDDGLNIRNRLAHGLMTHDEFTIDLCSLLLQVLSLVSEMSDRTSAIRGGYSN